LGLEAARFQMAEGAFKKWTDGVDMSMLDLDVEALRVGFKAGYKVGGQGRLRRQWWRWRRRQEQKNSQFSGHKNSKRAVR